MSGIKTGGDGARVQFDIPETDMIAVLGLIAMKGKRLKVTVEEIKQGLSYSGRLKDG